MQIYTKCPYATFENIQIQIIAAFTIIARENFIGILETLISHKQTSDVNRFFDLKSSNGEKSSIVSQSTIKKERWESYSLLPISPHQDVCPNNTKYVDTGYHYHEASVKDIAAVMPSPSSLQPLLETIPAPSRPFAPVLHPPPAQGWVRPLFATHGDYPHPPIKITACQPSFLGSSLYKTLE